MGAECTQWLGLWDAVLTYIQTSLGMALSRRFALGSPGGEVLATAVMGFIVRSGEGGEERGYESGGLWCSLFWVCGTC